MIGELSAELKVQLNV